MTLGQAIAMAWVPLSARQTLLWLDEQLFPEARYNNLVIRLDIQGELDLGKLNEAWRATVVARDSLRIVVSDREPKQAVTNFQCGDLPILDLPCGDLEQWIVERSARSLPRQDRPAWDAVILRLSCDRHLFYLCQHHLLTDGISMMNIIDELTRRYGGHEPLAHASFLDYLGHESTYRQSEKHKKDQAYFAGKLAAGSPPFTPYGIARTDRSVAINRVYLNAGRDLADRLTTIAKQDSFRSTSPRLSRLILIATALSAFIHRVTGNAEVLLALPWGNRTSKFVGTCGLLMEQLFLRIPVDPKDTFASLGQRVRTELIESMRHSQACLGDSKLEYVTLNMLPPLPDTFADRRAGILLSPAPVIALRREEVGDLRDTLRLEFFDFAERDLCLHFDFHSATFPDSIQERAKSHFVCMLEALAESPSASILQAELLDEGERQSILSAALGPCSDGPAPDFLARLQLHAELNSDRAAVIGPDGSLTYGQLAAFTNALAHRLRGLGVTHNSRVGVALPRGTSELVAFLATWKAGGAYVPVDPTHPIDRIRTILEDAAPEVLITTTDSPLAKVIPASTRFLDLSDLKRAIDGRPTSPLNLPNSPDQLAYILFTSGSTGRPKGVEVLRGSFANFLRSMSHEPGLTATDRLLAITTTTFDIAGLELFLPLWVGGTTIIADRETAMDPRKLRERIALDAINILQATPATWRLLLDAGFNRAEGMKLLCGGEDLSPEIANRLLRTGGELWNLYGPTETTVWSTIERVLPGEGQITIGRPIDRTAIYLLDSSMRLVPRGLIGEIHIGGDGLAGGYRGRPDLTAERFVDNPFGSLGERLYKTGDLGRLLEDNRFKCLGRVDSQVKIRGFRIELGEIESALRQVEGVEEVVVLSVPDKNGDPSLVAYWIGKASADELLRKARATLPAYMIPTAFVPFDTFPLTTSGKIDRKALGKTPIPAASPSVEKQLPQNDLELRVASIWGEMLDNDCVGVDEDFFALGGTSVLAIQVRSRLEEALGIELPLRAFFETPTVRGIVGRMGKSGPADQSIAVHVRRGTQGGPTIFGLLGIHLYLDLSMHLHPGISLVGLHVPIRYNPAWEAIPSVDFIAKHYLSLIRREQPSGPYYLLGFCLGGIVAFEVARRLEALGEQVAIVAIVDGYLPTSISRDYVEQGLEFLRRFRSAPAKSIQSLKKSVRRVLSSVSRGSTVTTDEMVELPFQGEAVERSVRQYVANIPLLEKLSAPVIIFEAMQKDTPPWIHFSNDLGWRRVAKCLSIHKFDCGHFGILLPPNVQEVSDLISSAMHKQKCK